MKLLARNWARLQTREPAINTRRETLKNQYQTGKNTTMAAVVVLAGGEFIKMNQSEKRLQEGGQNINDCVPRLGPGRWRTLGRKLGVRPRWLVRRAGKWKTFIPFACLSDNNQRNYCEQAVPSCRQQTFCLVSPGSQLILENYRASIWLGEILNPRRSPDGRRFKSKRR